MQDWCSRENGGQRYRKACLRCNPEGHCTWKEKELVFILRLRRNRQTEGKSSSVEDHKNQWKAFEKMAG